MKRKKPELSLFMAKVSGLRRKNGQPVSFQFHVDLYNILEQDNPHPERFQETKRIILKSDEIDLLP